jgi:hypothetical protein
VLFKVLFIYFLFRPLASENVVKKFNLSSRGIVAASNGMRITSSPYPLSGFIVGATIGLSFPAGAGH